MSEWEHTSNLIIDTETNAGIGEFPIGGHVISQISRAHAARVVADHNALDGLNPAAIKDVVEALQDSTSLLCRCTGNDLNAEGMEDAQIADNRAALAALEEK